MRLGRSRDAGGEERCKRALLPPCLTSRSDLTCCLLSGLVSLSILVIPACPCREIVCFQIAFPWCVSLLLSWFHPVTVPACSSEGRAQLRDTGQGAKGSSVSCRLRPCLTHAQRLRLILTASGYVLALLADSRPPALPLPLPSLLLLLSLWAKEVEWAYSALSCLLPAGGDWTFNPPSSCVLPQHPGQGPPSPNGLVSAVSPSPGLALEFSRQDSLAGRVE